MAVSNRHPFVSYQPIKLFYLLYRYSLFFARLPLWLIVYALFPAARQHEQWNFSQSILALLVRQMVDTYSTVGVTEKLTLEPGKEKDRFAILAPYPAKLYKGPMESSIVPAPIGGTWLPGPVSAYKPGPHRRVMLHFHGGAFVLGDGRTEQIGFLANTILQNAPFDAFFCPQYRLSGYENQNPFPAALQDALTSYLYFVRKLEIPASDIIISGDSAGGNLAIALLRYLEEYGSELDIPKPAGLVLISPWTSPAASLKPDITMTSNPHWSTDYLPTSFTRWGASTYSTLVPVTSPWITPLGHPFSTTVPIFVNTGAVELFEDSISQWAKEFSSVPGNQVEVNYEQAAPHDTLLAGHNAAWKESAASVAVEIGRFVSKKQNGSKM